MGSFSFHFLKNMWELVFALFLLCAGMGVVVLIYVWLAWYASLYVATQRERVNSYNNKPIKLSGLSKSDFQKLPTFFCTTQAEQSSNNKKNDVEKICINSDLECVVCLDQFQDGDKCLVLPKCRHCFHVPCADLWLSQRSICPICRGTVEIINIDQHPSIGNPQNSLEINPAEEQAPEPQLDAVGNINSDSHEDGVVIEIPALGNINSDSHEDDVVIEIPS